MQHRGRVVGIVGAGPVGSMLAVLLARRGWRVHLVDRRDRSALLSAQARDSTHVVISARGWAAACASGLGEAIERLCIRLTGRVVHHANGEKAFEAYDRDGATILCALRNDIQRCIFEAAAAEGSVSVEDGRSISGLADAHEAVSRAVGQAPDLIACCDGVNSSLRREQVAAGTVSESVEEFAWRYRELRIDTALEERDRVHVWPAGQKSIFAFPNRDSTATGTLFFPGDADGETREAIRNILGEGARFHLPEGRRPGRCVQVFARPVTFGSAALLGDAAHATTPFLGQGMNAGFDDAVMLADALESRGDIASALDLFQSRAQPHGEALVKLSQLHFQDLTEPNASVRRDRAWAEEWLDRELRTELPRVYPLVAFTRVGFADILQTYLARRAAVEHLLARRGEGVSTESLALEVKTMFAPRVPEVAKRAPRERY